MELKRRLQSHDRAALSQVTDPHCQSPFVRGYQQYGRAATHSVPRRDPPSLVARLHKRRNTNADTKRNSSLRVLRQSQKPRTHAIKNSMRHFWLAANCPPYSFRGGGYEPSARPLLTSTFTSTRWLMSRPSEVWLLSAGWLAPYPAGTRIRRVGTLAELRR